MTLGKDPNTVRVNLYVHQYGSPPVWVPYKTLIGYGRGQQLIIDDAGEQLYSTQEFETREAAVGHACAEANNRARENFPMSLRMSFYGKLSKNLHNMDKPLWATSAFSLPIVDQPHIRFFFGQPPSNF